MRWILVVDGNGEGRWMKRYLVTAWQASRDRHQAKVKWQFTTDDARIKLKRLYQTCYV